MSDFYIREGDTASDVEDVLRDANGNAVPIQGGTVRFIMVPLKGGAAKVDAEADNLDDGTEPNKGKVRWSWTADTQTDTPADYLLTWKVTYQGGKVQSFPNAGYLLLTVTPKAGDLDGYVSLEELKRTLKLQGLTFADGDALVSLIGASRGLEAEYNGGQPWTISGSEARYFTPLQGLTTVDIGRLISVTEVALDSSGAGAFSTILVAGTDYQLEPLGAGPWNRLRLLRSGAAWAWDYDPRGTPYPFGLDSLRITGVFGWAAVPEGVKAATSILATRVLRRMRDAPFGGAVGLGLEGAIARATSIAHDPEIKLLMKHPRRRRRLVV